MHRSSGDRAKTKPKQNEEGKQPALRAPESLQPTIVAPAITIAGRGRKARAPTPFDTEKDVTVGTEVECLYENQWFGSCSIIQKRNLEGTCILEFQVLHVNKQGKAETWWTNFECLCQPRKLSRSGSARKEKPRQGLYSRRRRADGATNEEEDSCPICLESMPRGSSVELPCKHRLCGGCLDEFKDQIAAESRSSRLGVSVPCPLCRAVSRQHVPAMDALPRWFRK